MTTNECAPDQEKGVAENSAEISVEHEDREAVDEAKEKLNRVRGLVSDASSDAGTYTPAALDKIRKAGAELAEARELLDEHEQELDQN